MTDEKRTADAAGLDEIIPAKEATPFQKAASGESVEHPSHATTPGKLPFSVSGLIACIIAAGALWIAFAQSSRMDELENQIAMMHAQMARSHEAMVSLNSRQTDMEQHLDDLARLKNETTAASGQETTAPVSNSDVATPGNEVPPAETTPPESTPEAPASIQPTSANAEPAATPPTHEQPRATPASKPISHTPKAKAVESKTMEPNAGTAEQSTSPATQTGPWKVNLVSGTSETAIKKETDRLQKLGVPVSYTSLQIKGKTWYRIYIPGFASKEEAQKKAAELRKQLHMDDIWIGK